MDLIVDSRALHAVASAAPWAALLATSVTPHPVNTSIERVAPRIALILMGRKITRVSPNLRSEICDLHNSKQILRLELWYLCTRVEDIQGG